MRKFSFCTIYTTALSVLILSRKYIIIISMKFLTKTVTLNTVEIVDENRMNHYELKADVWQQPDRKYKYTVELCRQKFNTFSINQKHSVGDRVSVIFRDGKCELLYDSVFYNLKAFTLDNPAVKHDFFNGDSITEINNLDCFVLKKGLRSERRRRAALKASPKSVKAKALILQRRSYGEWQVGGKSFVRFKLTLLLKNEKGYFITTFSDWDKSERFGSILKHVFDLSVGEVVPVVYSPDNPADIIVDYDNLKPFSLKPIPYIEIPEEDENL